MRNLAQKILRLLNIRWRISSKDYYFELETRAGKKIWHCAFYGGGRDVPREFICYFNGPKSEAEVREIIRQQYGDVVYERIKDELHIRYE